MAELSDNIYAAFGVFGFIVIGMGIALWWVVNRWDKDVDKSDKREERDFQLHEKNHEVMQSNNIMLEKIETLLKAKL